jgi:hypothetical protein
MDSAPLAAEFESEELVVEKKDVNPSDETGSSAFGGPTCCSD